jgi:AraC-like DNA-binding protein
VLVLRSQNGRRQIGNGLPMRLLPATGHRWLRSSAHHPHLPVPAPPAAPSRPVRAPWFSPSAATSAAAPTHPAGTAPRPTPVLQAIHEDAGRPWSVPELAAISGLSRAAFARTFHDALGQTPMQYLSDWRMALTRDHLRTGELGMTSIARSVGYSSPNAFAATTANHPAPGANGSHSATRNSNRAAPTSTDPRPHGVRGSAVPAT